jgi:hypothetical protein
MSARDLGKRQKSAPDRSIETSEAAFDLSWCLTSAMLCLQCRRACCSILDEPWKVLYRAEPYVLNPSKLFECVVDSDVVFPCAPWLTRQAPLAMYYGGADTVTCMALPIWMSD